MFLARNPQDPPSTRERAWSSERPCMACSILASLDQGVLAGVSQYSQSEQKVVSVSINWGSPI